MQAREAPVGNHLLAMSTLSAASDATASQSIADAGKHARQSVVEVEESEAFEREFIANMMAVKEAQLEVARRCDSSCLPVLLSRVLESLASH